MVQFDSACEPVCALRHEAAVGFSFWQENRRHRLSGPKSLNRRGAGIWFNRTDGGASLATG